MSPRSSGPTTPPVVYHVSRARRRWPAVLLAALALPGLVVGQVVVATAGRADRDVPTLAQPEPPPGDVAAVRPSPAPDLLPGPVREPDDLVVAPEVTIRFAVGAVLDDDGRDVLEPVAAVLAAPDAAPVLVLGSAEPGPDEAAALDLARERADVVRQALLDAGAAERAVRTLAVVDAELGRAVVVSSDVP